MRILLAPYGSSGDVHPFVGLGLALKARGHDVEMLTIHYFGHLAKSHGIPFEAIGEEGQFEEALENSDIWHRTRSLAALSKGVIRGMRNCYERIVERYDPKSTVIVGGSLAMGARLAQETHGFPLISMHLNPATLRSIHDTPIVANLGFLKRLPKFLKRGFYRYVDRVVDRHLGEGVNEYRAELGLQPVKRVMNEWWHSPDGVLALFPEWFAPRQPDWPRNLVQTGFPLYDEAEVSPMDPELERFLAEGSPPVVFAPGSAMRHAHDFFAESAESCRISGRRGLFVTRFAEQIPAHLPAGVRHFSYVPFSSLLPRSAALVHHGGVGTAAQSILAGISQLIRPTAHDQFDNAARLKNLGVSRTLLPERYKAPAIARELDLLLNSSDVAESCRKLAQRIRQDRPIEASCRMIESFESRLPINA